MSQDKTSDLVIERNATGSFSAFLDGVRFIESELCLYVKEGNQFLIVGTERHKNTVDFSVPDSLEADGPHTVTFPPTGRNWQVVIDRVEHPVVGGTVTVTFANYRKSVTGDFALDLDDNRKVTGSFDLKT